MKARGAEAKQRQPGGETEAEREREREECPAIIFAASAGHSEAITSSHKSRPGRLG